MFPFFWRTFTENKILNNNKKYFWPTSTHPKDNILYKYTYIQDRKYDQDVPVYEAVEDDEGGEGEDSDHNGGSGWHLKHWSSDVDDDD